MKSRRFTYITILLISIFIGSALSQSAPQVIPNRTTTRKSPEQIHLNVTVTGKKGMPVQGLDQRDFEISIEAKPARVVSFTPEERPISIGIVFDASSSMHSDFSNQTQRSVSVARASLRRFLELSNDANEYFLLGFNARPQLLVDWTSDRAEVVDGLNALDVGNRSAFYDACYLAIDKLQRSRHPKRVLILVSDGQDNISYYTFRETRELLKRSEVLLYAINFSRGFDSGDVVSMEGQSILSELSSLSGGVAISSKDGNSLGPRDALGVFEILANELRHQYTISVIPNGVTDGKKWRKIKVKVNPPAGATKEMKNLTVRTREGFY